MVNQARRVQALEPELQRLRWLSVVRNTLAHNKIVPWETLISLAALPIVDFRE